MEFVSGNEIEEIDNKTEVVIFHDMAEIESDNSKSLVWVGTQTFTIRHLDEEESVQHPLEEPSPSIVQNVETIEIVDSPNLLTRKRRASSLSQSKKRQKLAFTSASPILVDEVIDLETASPILIDEVFDLENVISSNKINRINNNVECINLDDDDDDEVEEIANASDNTMHSSLSSSSESAKQTPRIRPKGGPARPRLRKPLARKPSDCETWCAVCGISYGSEDNKFWHYLSHFGITPERCPRCQKYFSQSSTYYTHECSQNGMKTPQMELPNYPCEKNPDFFRKYRGKKMECSACWKMFPGMYKLKRHEISHTGEKPYKCFCCHRSFTQCNAMNRHICPKKIILADISPTCDICGKIFRNHMFVKIHKPIHVFEGRSDIDKNDIENAFKDQKLEIESLTDATQFHKMFR